MKFSGAQQEDDRGTWALTFNPSRGWSAANRSSSGSSLSHAAVHKSNFIYDRGNGGSCPRLMVGLLRCGGANGRALALSRHSPESGGEQRASVGYRLKNDPDIRSVRAHAQPAQRGQPHRSVLGLCRAGWRLDNPNHDPRVAHPCRTTIVSQLVFAVLTGHICIAGAGRGGPRPSSFGCDTRRRRLRTPLQT